MDTPKIYLAGPEVFLPDARNLGNRKNDLCTDYGFIGLYPMDTDINLDSYPPQSIGNIIFNTNCRFIEQANAVIANLTPFRGCSADPGTVWEVGYAYGRGLPIFSYTYSPDALVDRMLEQSLCSLGSNNKFIDSNGYHVEDFGLSDNLMISKSLKYEYRVRSNHSDPLMDLSGFIKCLIAARRHFFD